MKRFTKFVILLLTIVFCFSIFGCGPTNNTTSSNNPSCNHKGIGTCEDCNIDFDVLWKEFISNNGKDNKIGFDGDIGVLLTYTDEYDLYLHAITNTNGKDERTLTLTYNFYDRKWTWMFDYINGLGVAYGNFSQWSSRSSSLPIQYKNNVIEILYTDSELLKEIKRLYNAIISNANEKLDECKIGISMENFGLDN